jgi:hypothetical protein
LLFVFGLLLDKILNYCDEESSPVSKKIPNLDSPSHIFKQYLFVEGTAMGATGGDVEAGFAKLQGEDFEYYMQTYSIILGRNSKKSTVDVDLSSLGGGMNISRHHARIFYDFARRRFALEVLGKNGCFVEGVLHLPGNPPVKLDSQDLLQIGDKEFYFLLPVRSILGGALAPRHYVAPPAPAAHYPNFHLAGPAQALKKGRGRDFYEDDEYDDDDGSGGAKKLRREGFEGYGYSGAGGSGGKAGLSGALG